MTGSLVDELTQVLGRLQQTATGYAALLCKGAQVIRADRGTSQGGGSDGASTATYAASADAAPMPAAAAAFGAQSPSSAGDTAAGDPAAGDTAAGDSAGLPIVEYDLLAASQVVERLNGCSPAELEAVRVHELSNRHRRTILNRIDQLLSDGRG